VKGFLSGIDVKEEDLKDLSYVDINSLKEKKEKIRDKLNQKYKKNQEYNRKLWEDYENEKKELEKAISQQNARIDNQTSLVQDLWEKFKEFDSLNDYTQEKLGISNKPVSSYSRDEISRELQELINQFGDKRDFYNELQEIKEPDYIDARPDDSELRKIETQIEEAQVKNYKVEQAKKYKEQLDSLNHAEKKVNQLNKEIEKLENEHKELIQSSNLPVKGLKFDESGLILDDIPVRPDTISTSQQMELAFNIAIQKNKNVNVFKIAQGESLGPKRMQDIVRIAQNNGFQGFIETVSPDQELTIEEYAEINDTGNNK
jgi:hypothetical protein